MNGRVTEVTLTYQRKNSTGQYESEDIFTAIKISIEKGDDWVKAVDETFPRILEKVDKYSHEGARTLVRKFTVTDQNGDTVNRPQEKRSEGKEERGGIAKEPPMENKQERLDTDNPQSNLSSKTAKEMRSELGSWTTKNKIAKIPNNYYWDDDAITLFYERYKKMGTRGWNVFVSDFKGE